MDWNRRWRSLAAGMAALLAAGTAAAQTSGLKVQYKIPHVAVGDNHVRPHLQVVNTGTATVPMSELTLRYWYTVDGLRPQVYVCDYTPRGCGNVTSQFVAVSPARTNADFYLQLGFTAGMGSLTAGQSTGEIQGRFNKDNWTNYDESNDYSYDPTKLAFADWDRVTLYRNGVLVWGTEPSGGGGGADFSLAASPTTVSVQPGASGSSTITITRTGAFAASVALSTSTLPAGVTATFNPASATGSTSTLTFTAAAGAAPGSTAVTVSGTGGGLTRTTVVTLIVGVVDCTLSANPAALTVNRGGNGTSTITRLGTCGTGTTSFSASGLPAGVTATFNPPTTTGSSTVVTFTASATAALGTANVAITATGGGLTRTVTIGLTIVNGFSLTAVPASVTVNRGSSASSTITITRSSGFTASVALTLTGTLPAGVTATFTPSSTTGNTSTLSFAANATATPGTFPLTVNGAGGGLSRTVPVTLVVAAGDFTVSLAPATVSVVQGGSASSTATIVRTSGFTAAVACPTAVVGLPLGVSMACNPASTTGNSIVVTFTASATATVGTSSLTIGFIGGGLTRNATLSLTVAAAANFSLSASPSSLTIAAGSSGTSTITVARTGGFTGAVTLSGPAGVTFSPNPIAAAPATTSTATISVAAGTPAGTSTLTISGTATGITGARTTIINLTVTGSAAVFRVNPQGRITRNGQLFPVHCGSWFGLEGRHEPSSDPTNPSGAPMEQYIGNTFWANGGAGTGRTIQQTMTEIVAMGVNMVRLPVVPQTLNANDPQGRDPFLKNHSSVRVPNSRLALEQFIVAAAQNNIQILLDMHSCSNYVGWRKGRLDARPPYVDRDRDNYDFRREDSSCSATNNPPGVTRIQAYNQTMWLNDLRTLAGLGQQLGVDNIIGIDIFNEPWDYTWADWRSMAEAAYQAINAVNPNTLVFVQGISATANNQDGSPTTITPVPHGDPATNPNWGENLFEAGATPPNIPRDRLVFSPHTYGPSVFVQKMFMDPNQPQCAGLEGDVAGDADCNIVINPTLLRSGWEEHFGYLKSQGYAVVVGEFGGNLDWPLGQASIRDRNRWSHITPGVDEEWQNAFVDYMVDRGIEGCYWSINPESGDTAGWYGHAYDPITNTSGWGEWRDFDNRKTILLDRLWGR